MIRKSVKRFSEKIMFKQRAKAVSRRVLAAAGRAPATLHGVVFALLVRGHSLALLQHAVIRPPQMRRGAAIRPPGFRQRRHLLGVGSLLEAKPDLDGLLHGDVASRPRIAMAEAEQQINVGGPGADAV